MYPERDSLPSEMDRLALRIQPVVPDKHMDNAKDAIQKFAKSKKGRKAEEELKGPSRKAPHKSMHKRDRTA